MTKIAELREKYDLHMRVERYISDEVLRGIKAKTLVLAGSRDIIVERETRHIASFIPAKTQESRKSAERQ